MEHNRERVVPGFEAHGDVVDILTAEERAGDRNGASVHTRHERSVRPLIREDNDHDRRAAAAQSSRNQLADDLAELLELQRNVPQLPRRNIPDDVKVF